MTSKRNLLLCCLLLFSFFALAQKKQEPVPVIFDTDMGPDYDDAGAITMLHAYADRGQAKILATMASTRYEGVAAVLDVFNTYFKRPDIPVGVPGPGARDLRDWQHWTDTLIVKYPHSIRSNADATDAVALYRQILARQPDNSVTIITVGFLTNISNLLKSPADRFSSLTGKELVEKKVSKLVSMAGKFPDGKEFNIIEDAAAAKHVFENWTKPVIFSGFEIGSKIKTGLLFLGDNKTLHTPAGDVYRISIPESKEDSAGRMSWDQTAVLVAIEGHSPYYKLQRGSITVDGEGVNSWNYNKGNQHYLVEAKPATDLEKIINSLMLHSAK